MTKTADGGLSAQLQAERRAVETLYRAFSDHDPDLVDQALAPGWSDIPLAPGQGPGPAGFKPIILSVLAAFPDLRITIEDLIQAPARIAVRAAITGTHQGPLFGIAPTGKAIRFPIHDFHALEGERVSTTWHLEDWFGLFLQIGQFPTRV